MFKKLIFLVAIASTLAHHHELHVQPNNYHGVNAPIVLLVPSPSGYSSASSNYQYNYAPVSSYTTRSVSSTNQYQTKGNVKTLPTITLAPAVYTTTVKKTTGYGFGSLDNYQQQHNNQAYLSSTPKQVQSVNYLQSVQPLVVPKPSYNYVTLARAIPIQQTVVNDQAADLVQQQDFSSNVGGLTGHQQQRVVPVVSTYASNYQLRPVTIVQSVQPAQQVTNYRQSSEFRSATAHQDNAGVANSFVAPRDSLVGVASTGLDSVAHQSTSAGAHSHVQAPVSVGVDAQQSLDASASASSGASLGGGASTLNVVGVLSAQPVASTSNRVEKYSSTSTTSQSSSTAQQLSVPQTAQQVSRYQTSYNTQASKVLSPAANYRAGTKTSQNYAAKSVASPSKSHNYGTKGARVDETALLASARARPNSQETESAKPFAFKFEAKDDKGVKQARHESRDDSGRVSGSYSIVDAVDGLERHVTYEADENGFRAQVHTNEPGTKSSSPANVQVDSTYDQAKQY